MSCFISVRPQNHTILLGGEKHPCDETVYVSRKGSSTLKCSVDSKPQAQFTWAADSGVFGPIPGTTTCVLRSDKVYNCSNTLIVPNESVPTGGVKVNCHVEAVGNRTDICVTLGEFPACASTIYTSILTRATQGLLSRGPVS